jgi:hypothetical protein
MEKTPIKTEYRIRDYALAFIQTLLMTSEELKQLQKRFNYGELEDICEPMAKERYQEYLRNRRGLKLQIRNNLTSQDYRI